MPRILSSYPAISDILEKKNPDNQGTVGSPGTYSNCSLPEKSPVCPRVKHLSSVSKATLFTSSSVQTPTLSQDRPEKFPGKLSENGGGNVLVSADERGEKAVVGTGATLVNGAQW